MDSLHEIAIAAGPQTVFAAWTTGPGLAAWWTRDVTVPGAAGENYVLSFDGGNVRFHFRPVASSPDAWLRWTGVEGPNMPAEWVGTEIDVRLGIAPDGRTRLQFSHKNWRSAEGFYCVCNTTWGELMYRLRDHCEGRPRGPLFT